MNCINCGAEFGAARHAPHISVAGVPAIVVSTMLQAVASATCEVCGDPAMDKIVKLLQANAVPTPAPAPKAEIVAALTPPPAPKAEAVIAVATPNRPAAKPPAATPAKPGIRALVEMIVAGKQIPVRSDTKMENALRLTECVVHANNSSACLCGGWHDWATMPSITYGKMAFGFGDKCAEAATVAFKSRQKPDPFAGAAMLDVAVRAIRGGRHATAGGDQPAPKRVPVGDPPSPRPEPVRSVIKQAHELYGIVHPDRSECPREEAPQIAARLERASKLFKRLATAKAEDVLDIYSQLDLLFRCASGSSLELQLTKDEAQRLCEICFGYFKGYKDLALPSVYKSGAKIVDLAAARKRAERDNKKAERSLKDAALRSAMKGTSNGGGKKNKKNGR